MLTQASDLPKGELLTKKGAKFDLPEKQKSGGMVAITSGDMECWVLATESFWQSPFFIQLKLN